MQHFISIHYKTPIKKLYLAEHYRLYSVGIIKPMLPLMGALPQVSGTYNSLSTVFDREDTLYKLSQASMQTQDIGFLNGKRAVNFSYFWASVAVFKYEDDAASRQAVQKLEFLHNTYKGMIYANYYEMSGLMLNFLQDCEKPEYKPSIQLLGLTAIVTKLTTIQAAFDDLYEERSQNKEHVATLGKLSEVRIDVDAALEILVEAINFNWRANEMGAKDATVRNNLLAVRDVFNAAIHQVLFNLAHRGAHKMSEDGKETEGTQTPDTTNPPAPGTPNQNPDTTNPPAPDTPNQNPSGGPHPLDPNEHPSMGE